MKRADIICHVRTLLGDWLKKLIRCRPLTVPMQQARDGAVDKPRLVETPSVKL